MKRTSARASDTSKSDWSRGVRGKYAARFADKRWQVRLDPELVELLSGDGGPAARLLGIARRKGKRTPRRVVIIPMSDRDYAGAKALLQRIGAKVERIPPHPNWSMLDANRPMRRQAG